MVLLIYKSKTGFTEKYANWIAEEIECDLVEYKDRKKADLQKYDTIIYGGGFFAGIIGGLNWLKKQIPSLKEKKLIVFATGAMSPDLPDVEKAMKLNFTADEWRRVKTFYFQSGLNYERMGTLSRLLMKMVSKNAEKSGDESNPAKSESFDASSKDFIYPLIRSIDM